MKIASYTENGILNILVLKGDEKKSQEKMRSLLGDGMNFARVFIIELQTIPAWLVHQLHKLAEKNVDGPMTINVTSKYMSRYLAGLGIRHALLDEPAKIPSEAVVYENLNTEIIADFLARFRDVYGIDFTSYCQNGVKLVFGGIMKNTGIQNPNELIENIFEKREYRQIFIDGMSVGFTSFFRDAEYYKFLKDEVLGRISSHHHFKIWSAGCANGMEPYSVAILLEEMGLLDRSVIYATDFNENMLDQAKNGLYPIKTLLELEESCQSSGCKCNIAKHTIDRGSYFEISPNIRKKVHFFRHNLATDSNFNEFELILCRNVIIYFDDELKIKVLRILHDSLSHDGFLGLGSSENIHNYLDKNNFFQVKQGLNIYRKKLKGMGMVIHDE